MYKAFFIEAGFVALIIALLGVAAPAFVSSKSTEGVLLGIGLVVVTAALIMWRIEVWYERGVKHFEKTENPDEKD